MTFHYVDTLNKRPARGLPLSSFHGTRAPFGASVACGADSGACNGGGAGHKNPASAVSGLCGLMDTCGYLSGHIGNWREPLLMGIIIIIISMTCAIRCCISHSDVVDSWRYGCSRLHFAGQMCSLLAGHRDFRCAGLKVIWRIPGTSRTSNWQLRDTGRNSPACRLARTSPMKIWLDRMCAYMEHMTARVNYPGSITGNA